MQLIDELRAEHNLIEQVVGSFRSFVDQRTSGGQVDPADGPRFMQFFRLYAGHFHHAREEDTLFVALERDAELPADRGPIPVLLHDHALMAGVLDQLEPLLSMPLDDEPSRERLRALATQYSHALWHHIDAENSVLLPESEHRLRRHSVHELPTREMSGDEEAAKHAGEALLRKYQPLADPVMRGDGCVLCPWFGESCRGLEHEWWSEWEWDEFEDHLPNG